MDDLIKALTILRKYGNPTFPTLCEHDILVVNILANDVSEEDIQILETLGFTINENNNFQSFKFGSC